MWTVLSRPATGKGRMEKSIYTREYTIVRRLLREARARASLTQTQVAAKLKQSQSFITKLERGDRRIDIVQLHTICRIYGITLGDFVELLERELARK